MKGIQNRLPRNAGRFLLVGLGITMFDLVFCTALCAALPPATAYLVSYVVCITVRFWLDKQYTFQNGDGDLCGKYLRYWLACLVTLLIGWGGFGALIRMGFPYLFAKLISLVPVTVSGYVLFRWFVFADWRIAGLPAEETAAGVEPALPLRQWETPVSQDSC